MEELEQVGVRVDEEGDVARQLPHTTLMNEFPKVLIIPRAVDSGSDRNQVEDAQAQEGAQTQRITSSMARALGKECQMMTLLISLV